ncbi:MAG TPA: (d)CMP kinase [Synergistales bacterium]|nr:(d)CMP kinase [Synergistales bacterium]
MGGVSLEMISSDHADSTVITIDGPAGAGKSTIARLLAGRIGFQYLDTGAIYRTIAYCLSRNSVPPVENDFLCSSLACCRIGLEKGKIILDGKDVSDQIRSQKIDRIVSSYAALPMIRRFLIGIQREQAAMSDIVADGRDMGSVVFPEAALKIYLDADVSVRAERRMLELSARGETPEIGEILENIRERDRKDREREVSPLMVPEGAHIIDTTGFDVDEVVTRIMALVSPVIGGSGRPERSG